MNSEIVSIKLKSGEEIIARVESELDHGFNLCDVRVLMIFPTGEMKLAPLLYSCPPDKSIMVYKSAVSAISYTLREDFEKSYRQSVSKIVTIDKKILI